MPKKVPIKIQTPNGFSKAHSNILTAMPGTIVPVLVDEVMPRTKIHLKDALQASLPPLAFDTFMRASIELQAFFVPTRLLVGNYEDFFSGQTRKVGDSTYSPVMPFASFIDINSAEFGSGHWPKIFAPGTLADYLGCRSLPKTITPDGPVRPLKFSLLPFLAYHRIYNDWFRNTLVQKDIMSYPADAYELDVPQPVSAYSRCYLNDLCYTKVDEDNFAPTSSVFKYEDGVSLWELRQRNFKDDYFTIAQPNAQSGDPVSISVVDNKFTIASFRGANAAQRYAEVKGFAGPRYVDELYAQYGAVLKDGVAQRAILLGSQSIEVYSKGVYQTGNGNEGNNNPFDSVGARYGDGIASDSGVLVDEFEAMEPGYFFVVAELVPRVTYSSGMSFPLSRYVSGDPSDIGDLANPTFQGVGNQAIPVSHVAAAPGSLVAQTFGYGERFCDWKTMLDECHGLVRDGESLASMVLQRTLDAASSDIQISSSFLQIPKTYFDNITAVTSQVSEYGYWLDIYFDYSLVMPLEPYSIPCLEDPAYEHKQTVEVPIGGKKID